ncbi:MAG TPA: CSLREA domain-containing protein, partial [Pyrinomonadaceae bacterium]|nr:CSLREA domain-containing protein [Pyrinomonadaceae bacterium]
MFAKLSSIIPTQTMICRALTIAALLALTAWAANAATYTVTKTADTNDGTCDADCSLREAIVAANNNPGADLIAFNIGSGLKTIQPLSQLPTVSDAVTIDGTTQPGFAGAPLIELDGSLTTNAYGFFIASDTGSAIRGLIINRFQSPAINLAGNGGHLVAGNYIGTNAAGNATFTPNNPTGISVNSPNNVIGGTTAADRNIISGNKTPSFSIGVDLFQSDGNKVIGNYIGTDVTGTVTIDQTTGMRIFGNGNIVGGATIAERNVISGNGVGIDVSGANNNKIQGNFLGPSADGKKELAGLFGVFVEGGSTNNLI